MNRMVLWLAAALLAAACLPARAQRSAFTLMIADPAALPVVTPADSPEVHLAFPDEGLTALAAGYHVYSFVPAYPAAPTEYLRSLYLVEADSGLMQALTAYSEAYFPYAYAPDPSTARSLGLPPDDSLYGDQGELRYVHLDTAWNVTHGDSTIRIAVSEAESIVFGEHPYEMIDKGISYRPGPTNTGGNHGIAVAGMVGARTNNNRGIAAAGYDCRPILNGYGGSTNRTFPDILTMVNDMGASVVNASWKVGANYDVNAQYAVDAVYEAGATFVAAAGDGYENQTANLTDPTWNPRVKLYPASYEHVLSVTGVGWKRNRSTALGTANMKDVFDNSLGDSLKRFNYNDAVDLCAPGQDITLLAKTNYTVASGTSFSSPMVAGTVGLMQAAFKANHPGLMLSPYQVEYILKQTAYNLDTIPQNLPFAGGLGAGKLEAGKAVQMAAVFDPNNAATETFTIDGVTTTTLCKPDSSVNVIRPQLSIYMRGGTPPYTYDWAAVAGNQATIDSRTTATPTVTSVGSNNTLYYRLTVRDASPTTKVAGKFVKIIFKSGSTAQSADLAMRDHFADDMMEPYRADTLDRRDWDIWRTPDLWNRQTRDGITEHQNAEYYRTDSNYLYVHIRNVGCKTYTANDNVAGTVFNQLLRMYWTLGSTGENWDYDWTGQTYILSRYGQAFRAGGEITENAPVYIQTLAPGEDTTIAVPWRAPSKDSLTTADHVVTCVLARIRNERNRGSSVLETDLPNLNSYRAAKDVIKASNNVVSRNLEVVDLNTANKTASSHLFMLANPYGTGIFRLRVTDYRDRFKYLAGDYGSVGTLSLTFSDGPAYSAWLAAGALGNYTSRNDGNRTIKFDNIRNMVLEGMTLDSDAHLPVVATFTLRDPDFVTTSEHYLNIAQYTDGEDELVGNITFRIRVVKQAGDDSYGSKPAVPAQKAQRQFSVYPNPNADGTVMLLYSDPVAMGATVQVIDMTGRTAYTGGVGAMQPGVPFRLALPPVAGGLYQVILSDGTGRQTSTRLSIIRK